MFFNTRRAKILILSSLKKLKNKSKNRSDLEISRTNSALTSSNSVPNLVKKSQLWYIRERRESFTSRFAEVRRVFIVLLAKFELQKFCSGQIRCKKVQTRWKSNPKMVNTAFAYQFTWGCKFEGKRGIYHLYPHLKLVCPLCTIFALMKIWCKSGACDRLLCKSNFLCSRGEEGSQAQGHGHII